MKCINNLSNQGFSCYRYLVSAQKEKNFVASFCKTSLAIALLVPGILVALGCAIANVFLSPCLKTKAISQQPFEKNSSTIPTASPKILKRMVEKEAPPSSKIEEIVKNGSSETLFSSSKSVDLPNFPQNSSGESSESSAKENDPILISKYRHILTEETAPGIPKKEKEFRDLAKLLLQSYLMICKKGDRFREKTDYSQFLPRYTFDCLGDTGLTRVGLNAALAQPIDAYISNEEMCWGLFRDVCHNTLLFLNGYERAFDLHKLDPADQDKFQSWHKEFCETTIEIWMHGKNIIHLLGATREMELAGQILARFEALSAKKIAVSADQ